MTGLNPATYTFIPAGAGQINRNFVQVSSDGMIYCYDSFYDPIGQALLAGPTILVQMLSATTLRIERQAPTTCGAGPWAFTSNAIDFQR